MSRKKGDKPDYPSPKKGQPVRCMGCNNGWVQHGKQVRKCQACKGTGYINA